MELSVQYICATLLAVFCLCHIIGAMGQSNFTKISEDEQEVVFECVTFGPGTTQYSVTGCDIDEIQLLHYDFTTGGASNDCYNSTIGLCATARSISTDGTSYRSNLTILSNATIVLVVECFHELGNNRTPVGVPFIIEPTDLTPAATSVAPTGVSTTSPTSDLTPGSTTTEASTGLPGGVTAAVVVVVLAVITATSVIVGVVARYMYKKRRRSEVQEKLNITVERGLIGLGMVDTSEGQSDEDGGVGVEQPKVETDTGKKKPEANCSPEPQVESEKEKEWLREENQRLKSKVNDLEIIVQELRSQHQRDNNELQRTYSELHEKEANEKRLNSELEYLRDENRRLCERIKKLEKAIADEECERKADVDKLQRQREEDNDKFQRQREEDNEKFQQQRKEDNEKRQQQHDALASLVNYLVIEKENDSTFRSAIEINQEETERLLVTAQNEPDTSNVVATGPGQSLVAEGFCNNEQGRDTTDCVESPLSEGERSPDHTDTSNNCPGSVPPASQPEERNGNGGSAQHDPVSKYSAKTEHLLKHLKDGASGIDAAEGLEKLGSTMSSFKEPGSLSKNGNGLERLPE